MAGLNDRQAAFVEAYAVKRNATQAALDAGYSPQTAGAQGHALLKHPEIRKALGLVVRKAMAATEITPELILKEMAKIAFGEVVDLHNPDGSIRKPHEWDETTAANISGVEMGIQVTKDDDGRETLNPYVAKVRRYDKIKALEMLARTQAMFKDTLDVGVTEGLADRLARATARANREEPRE